MTMASIRKKLNVSKSTYTLTATRKNQKSQSQPTS